MLHGVTIKELDRGTLLHNHEVRSEDEALLVHNGLCRGCRECLASDSVNIDN